MLCNGRYAQQFRPEFKPTSAWKLVYVGQWRTIRVTAIKKRQRAESLVQSKKLGLILRRAEPLASALHVIPATE